MTRLDKILVPVDFSACSRAAFDYARFLAGRLAVHIHVVHVWEPPLYVPKRAIIRTEHGEEDLEAYLAGKRVQEMQRFLGEDAHAPNIKHRLQIGDPVREIVRIADEEEFDLLVVGTRGRGGLAHALLGSTAERIVRLAPCPVLTVRAPQP